MKRVVWGVLLASVSAVVAAAPAVAAPGPPDHPEWWFDTWNVPGLWAGGARGQGITIGEIDTGVNASLPELSANVLSGTDFGDFGGNGQTDRDTDDFGHGTAMASLMVAHDGQDNILGMAPDAHVLPVAVPITGTTDDAGDQAGQLLLQAIRWAADHGAKIISMSLGSQRDPADIGRSCPVDEQGAIDYALSKGAIVVASGGNSGDSGSPIEDPGVCLGVVSVGAVDNANNVPVWSSKHPYLTVAAPGVDVPSISKIPGEAFFGDGTSQAAALTSAGLAVIWSKYPQLTNRQVVARLLATVDFKHTTRDSANGYGVINIGAAVTANVPPDAPNPIYDAVAPFLAQDKALASPAADPKVKPAAIRKEFPGSYAVAAAPNPLTSGPGLGGIVGAGVGLIAMVFLVLGATVRRRRLAVVGVTSLMSDPPTEPIPIIPADALSASDAGPTTIVPGGTNSPDPVASTREPNSPQERRAAESDWLTESTAALATPPRVMGSPAGDPTTPSPAGSSQATGFEAATVDSPGEPDSPIDGSSTEPAIEVDSPTGSDSAAIESPQDGQSLPPPVDSPGEAGSSPGESSAEPASPFAQQVIEGDSPGSESAASESAPAGAPVDSLGDVGSSIGVSSVRPAVGVDSPVESMSVVGESTQERSFAPAAVDSRGEVGSSPGVSSVPVAPPVVEGDSPGLGSALGESSLAGAAVDSPVELTSAFGESTQARPSAPAPVDSPGEVGSSPGVSSVPVAPPVIEDDSPGSKSASG